MISSRRLQSFRSYSVGRASRSSLGCFLCGPTQDPNSSAKIRRRRISSTRWPRDQTGTHTLCRCSDHTCDDARSIIAIDAEHCWNINQHHAIDQRSVLCTLTLKSLEPRIESPCPVDMLFTVADWPYLLSLLESPGADREIGNPYWRLILEIDTGDVRRHRHQH